MVRAKGAVAGLPVLLLVAVAIAVIVLLIALAILGVIPGITGTEATRAALASCCTGYRLEGNCGLSVPKADFVCKVPKEIDPSGSISIAGLVSKAGASSIQAACCR